MARDGLYELELVKERTDDHCMSTADETPDRPPSPLEYARALPPDARISKLAIVALIVSVLGSPCLLGPLSNWINWHVPQQYRQTGHYGYLHFYAEIGALLLASTLSLMAIGRIRESQGRLLGKPVAWAAVIISSLWWALIALAFLLVFLSGGRD